MADVKFNDESTIVVDLSNDESISTKLQDINYIPGYIEAENQRRTNEEIRISNENERISYFNDMKSKVEEGYFNGKDGVDGINGVDGKDGIDGVNGIDGEDGISPTIEVKTDTEDEYVLTITDVNGEYDTPNLKGSGGGIADESDPTVPDYVKNITEEDIAKWNETYTLPIATADALGGIKIGENLTIDENGVVSASGGGGSTYEAGDNIVIENNVIDTKVHFYIWDGKSSSTTPGNIELFQNIIEDISSGNHCLVIVNGYGSRANNYPGVFSIGIKPGERVSSLTASVPLKGHDLKPENSNNSGYHKTYLRSFYATVEVSAGAVKSVTAITNGALLTLEYLNPNTNYGTVYTPKYNGSPATKKYVDDSIGEFVTLYEDEAGTNETVTLSESSANFEYLEFEIAFMDTKTNRQVQRVYNPNGTEFSCVFPYYQSSASAMGIYCKSWNIAETEITNNLTYMWNSNNYVGEYNKIYIMKVTGKRIKE